MNCKNCDELVLGRQATAEFCSDKCRNTYRVREKRHKKIERLKLFPALYRLFRERENARIKKYQPKPKPKEPKPRKPPESRDRREYRREWEKNNHDKVALNRAKQGNRRRGLPHTLTLVEWKSALEYFNHKCAYCGNEGKLHKEHFVPAARGGGYTRNNIIPACSKCNGKKHSKNPIEWLVTLPNTLVVYARIVTYLSS